MWKSSRDPECVVKVAIAWSLRCNCLRWTSVVQVSSQPLQLVYLQLSRCSPMEPPALWVVAWVSLVPESMSAVATMVRAYSGTYCKYVCHRSLYQWCLEVAVYDIFDSSFSICMFISLFLVLIGECNAATGNCVCYAGWKSSNGIGTYFPYSPHWFLICDVVPAYLTFLCTISVLIYLLLSESKLP